MPRGGRSRWRRTVAALTTMATLVLSSAALAANPNFPSTNPNESVRINTPDDPNFDRCEPHLPGEGTQTCANVFNQEFERFGFAPLATQNTATYKNPTDPHVQRLMAQNTLAGRTAAGQVPGVSADRAWKFSIGRADVQVGIVDTGIEWNDSSLRTKVALNPDELPEPLHDRATPVSDGADCAAYSSADDANGDGAYDVLDYVCDSRVDRTAGPNGDNQRLDAQDLLAEFSNGDDADSNGYVDDIAGWDFFDDDNDAHDASSYSSAEGHGSGRAEEAAARTNDASGGTGVCPKCQFVPLRAWDSFVVDTNNFGQAVTYAADNEVEVIEGAVGGLYNSRFNREAFDYAYRKGVFFAIVSSDANTAAHNFPTVYNESLMIAGVVADQHGLGYSGNPNYPPELINFFSGFGISLIANAPVETWFRNSGLTQYGGHAGIVMPATTGSQGTGQASGAAGLLASYGRQRSAGGQLPGGQLQPNEIKQILTMTAEDVVPENTVGTGVPDPAQVGWDQHFGYGKPDLGLALEWIRDGKIPPQALITSPDWFAPLNVDDQSSVQISGRLSAPRAAAYTWQLQWAPGIEPCEEDFRDVGTVHNETGAVDGPLGTIDLTQVRAALDARVATNPSPACRQAQGPVTGGSTVDPTAPSKGPGDRDPNEPAFTVRVVVNAGTNRGEHRKTLFAYRDPSVVHPGWSKSVGAGGEASQRMYDLNGDNKLDIVQADSGGTLAVFNADGSPLSSFNGGNRVKTDTYANVHPGAPAYSAIEPPEEVLRTPAIGDIDSDQEPEIVASAGEHVYAWNADGSEVSGFPVRLDPAKSSPPNRSKTNHVKRGFIAAPTLGDFVGDGALEITIPGLDQHLYAWDGSGTALPGFPKLLKKPGEAYGPRPPAGVPGAESTTTAAVGDIGGDGKPEIVTPTNELEETGGGSAIPLEPAEGRIYAVDSSGAFLPGWPAEPSGQLPGLIPLLGPSVENALGDLDGDGKHEAVGSLTSADVKARGSDGQEKVGYVPEPVASSETVGRSLIINTFEYPIVANLNGGSSLEVIKGGVTIEGLANLLVVGQNVPYNHVVQAWDGASGNPLPGWPQAVEDWQWVSNPAVADVSDAPGHEVLAPTGLYTIRNMNAQGLEGGGWPKFTGGWNMATPAVGDADGDGKLEVAAITREGNSFLWDTDQPACATNNEWWTSRHDERNTGAYGTDTRPPGTPRSLAAARSGETVALTWTVPGDDWLCGAPRRYRIVRSANPVTRPTDGTIVGDFDSTKQVGEGESRTVENIPAGQHLAVLYQDDAGNWGHLASTATPTSNTPICADIGPLPVTRNESKPLNLSCVDADGDDLTLEVVDQPDHGDLGPIDQATGTVTYTPDPDYEGPDSFTYQASDGANTSNTATVSLQVGPRPNRAPECRDVGPVAVDHGKAKRIALSCTDPEGDAMTLSRVSGPSKGRLGNIDQTDDSVVYTPNRGASGADEFTYRANDAREDSNTAKVSLRIAPAPPSKARGRAPGPGAGGGPGGDGGPGGAPGATRPGVRCDRPTGRARGSTLDRARLGRRRSRMRRAFQSGARRRARVDRFCLTGPGSLRVGYRRGRAVLLLTSSRRFAIRRVRLGASRRTLRRRAGRLRRFRIGANTWYVRRGTRARLVFKVRRGRVREIGLSSLRLTSGRRARRFLRSFF